MAGEGGGDAGKLTVVLEANAASLRAGLDQGTEALARFDSRSRDALRSVAHSAQETADALNALGIKARAVSDTRITVPTGDLANATAIAKNLNRELTVTEADLANVARAADRTRIEFSSLRAEFVSTTTVVQEASRNAFGFTAVQQRLANGALAVAFGLDQLARSGEDGAGAIQSIARAASVAALAFGPSGLLVGAALSAGDAIFSVFDRKRREMEATERQFFESLNRMRDADDAGGLARLQQTVFSGKTEFDAHGDKIFTPGLQQFREQNAALQKLMQDQRDILRDQENRAQFDPATFSRDAIDRAKHRLSELQSAVDALSPTLIRAERRFKDVSDSAASAIAKAVDTTDVGIRLAADEQLARSALRRATSVERATDREIEALRKAAEAGDAAALRIAGDRLAGRGAADVDDGVAALARILSARTEAVGAAFAAAIRHAPLETRTALIDARVRVETTRDELVRQVESILPADDAFALIQVRVNAQLAGITTDLRNMPTSRTSGGANPYLLPDFQPGGRFDTVEKFTRTTSDRFRQVATDAELVARAFSNLPGLADSFAARLLNATAAGFGGAAAIGGGLGDIRKGGLESLTGVASVVTGILGVAGGLISIGDALTSGEREQAAVRRENTRALERLRDSLDAEAGTLARLLAVQSFAGGTSQDFSSLAFPARLRAFNDELAASGLTLAQVRAEAERMGVSISDASGHLLLTTDTFDALASAADLTATSLTSFANTFEGVNSRLDARRRIFDQDTPQNQAQDTVSVIEQFGGPFFKQLFANIDTSTAAGRAALEAAERTAFTFLETATPAQRRAALGDLTLPQFQQLLLDGDAALDSFNDATRKATDAMLNLPTGFKVAAAVYAAQDPTAIGATIPVEGPATRGPGWERHVAQSTTNHVEFHFHGPINTQAKNAAELFDDVVQESARRARSMGGDAGWILKTLGRA